LSWFFKKKSYNECVIKKYLFIKSIKMVKVIRKPLTDIYGRDFKTWEVIKSEPIEQELNLESKIKKWKEKKIAQAIEMGRTDGKIFVDGLGWVS